MCSGLSARSPMRRTVHLAFLLAFMLVASAWGDTVTARSTHHRTAVRHRAHRTRTHTSKARAHHHAPHTPDYESGYKAGFAAGLAAAHRDSAPKAAVAAKATHHNSRDHEDSPDIEPQESTPEAAPEPASLHLRRGALPSLRGSLASLIRQNRRLDAEGLERIETESDLKARIAHHFLVPVPVSASLTVNPELESTHRYCRPWTARFLADLARAHEMEFHRPLEVSSAVRTVDYQRRLRRRNGNAAAAVGNIVSPHLTGATVDITKKEMSPQELMWMRRHLLALQDAGKIDVEEEFEQACFHITVYKTYLPPRKTRSANKAHAKQTPPALQQEQASNEAPERSE